MTRYVGLWDGGSNYATGFWADDAEAFDSLETAVDTLRQRAEAGHWLPSTTRRVTWDEGAPVLGELVELGLTPNADEGPSILLAPWESTRLLALEQNGPYACSHLLELGPRRGVKITRL